MGMLDSLLGKLDATLGDADAREVRSAARRGDTPILESNIDGTTEWSYRAFYAELAARARPGRPAWLDGWSGHSPQSAAAHLVSGINHIHLAWEARGFEWVPKNHGEFQRLLRLAEASLRQAARLAPSDPTPHAWLARTAYGLSQGADAVEAHAREALARDPHNRLAHSNAVQGLASKWGGRDERMWDFVKASMKRAPEGALSCASVVEAMLELGATAERQRKVPDLRDFMKQDGVRSAVVQAGERFYSGVPKGSIYDQTFIHGYFALGGDLAGVRELASKALALMGDRVVEYPWFYFGSPVRVARSVRSKYF
ncbi:MAG: hypothetical protein RBS39_02485 [Phycisphaerales bacterium]|jgi:hypothetical protein|nr:hypothetical protein [Phycisphaerales bacterium]